MYSNLKCNVSQKVRMQLTLISAIVTMFSFWYWQKRLEILNKTKRKPELLTAYPQFWSGCAITHLKIGKYNNKLYRQALSIEFNTTSISVHANGKKTATCWICVSRLHVQVILLDFSKWAYIHIRIGTHSKMTEVWSHINALSSFCINKKLYSHMHMIIQLVNTILWDTSCTCWCNAARIVNGLLSWQTYCSMGIMLAGIIVLEHYVAFLFEEYQLNWLNRALNVHSLHKLLSRHFWDHIYSDPYCSIT